MVGSEKKTMPGRARPMRNSTVSPVAQPAWWRNGERDRPTEASVCATATLPSPAGG